MSEPGFEEAGFDEAGLEEAGFEEAGRIIEETVAAGEVPGVVAAVGRGPGILRSWTAGYADLTPGAGAPGKPGGRPMRPDTVFDLASLTKVVATTTMTLALAGAGLLGLDDPVPRYLPVTWTVTIRHLLTHTAGLPPIVRFFESCADRDEVLRSLYATPLEAPPGTRVAYSDLGFMALGEILAQVSGEPLQALFRQTVAAPLGMRSAGYIPLSPDGPPAGPPTGGFAATERRDDGTPWTGIVHDENARAMGGVAGHAGLFATVSDLARFAAWWAGPDDGPVPVALRREAERCQTLHLDGRRGLGWTCIGDRYDILGKPWPATAVSHTGFTGTSLALDSPAGIWVALLTNRVHLGRDASAPAIKSLRRDIHAAVARSLLH